MLRSGHSSDLRVAPFGDATADGAPEVAKVGDYPVLEGEEKDFFSHFSKEAVEDLG